MAKIPASTNSHGLAKWLCVQRLRFRVDLLGFELSKRRCGISEVLGGPLEPGRFIESALGGWV